MMPSSGVSRETLLKFERYAALLSKWNPAINLISKSSMEDIWSRHIWDSAQAYKVAASQNDWVDIGSGGGLPGIVIAILAQEQHPERNVEMIESDSRKATFLRSVIRDLGLRANVKVDRIENAPPSNASILSARALADLTQLLHYAKRHLAVDGQALFFKGKSWKKEVEEARRTWSFDLISHKSKTDPEAAILEIKDIQLV